MMEKVKLTQEQAHALETLKLKVKGMLVVDLLDALKNGYVVESEYKLKDWVYSVNSSSVGQVVRVGNSFVEMDNDTIPGFDYIRHATPEEIKAEQERRVWAGIGREVGEFRVGDGYLYDTNALYNIDCEQRIRVVREAYDGDKLVGFYPAESFISFGGESHDN